MQNVLPEPLLAQLGERLTASMGVRFAADRLHELDRAMGAVARDLGSADPEQCAKRLLSAPLRKADLEILASYLTVGETYLFRDPHSFEVVEQQILPDLIRARRSEGRRLRIWSAGCCTGEEPYTLAIVLDRLIPDLEDWNVTILATDINPQFLSRARKGRYTEWSFRGVPECVRERYFDSVGARQFDIRPALKRIVTFAYLNLAEDCYPALSNGTNAIDLIFCRNVLMYFSPEIAQRVADGMLRCLVDGGSLVVSPVETSPVLFKDFSRFHSNGVTIYRRKAAADVPLEASWRSEPPTITVPWLAEIEYDQRETTGSTATCDDRPFPAEAPLPESQSGGPQARGLEEAQCLFSEGRYAEATEAILALRPKADGDAQAIELLARALANQGRLGEAAEWCKKAIAGNKLDGGCHFLLAAIQQELGSFAEAAESLKRSLYLDPALVIAHFALGNLAREQGRFGEAERHFGNALELLYSYDAGEVLPESDGLTAQRLAEIIDSVRRP